MKRVFSILLALALCVGLLPAMIPTVEAAGSVAVNVVNFPDSVFRGCVSAGFDKDGDGALSASELAAVTEINVNSKGISTLKGVEYFTSLTSLYCTGNQLTALDLSKNKALTRLSCGGNRLTRLDVSVNTALTTLYCHGNQLTSLKVAPAMKNLYCQNNALTSLDVNGCAALENLSCDYNALTALDVSQNPALVGLSCGHNALAALDVSQNPALTYLGCGGNQLSEVDLRSNAALVTLDASDNAPLQQVNFGGSQNMSMDLDDNTTLQTLDLSGCTSLKSIYCFNNRLQTLDVSGCTSLDYLFCWNNGMRSLDVRGCTAMTDLLCYDNDLTELDLTGCPDLMGLNCRGNYIDLLDLTPCYTLADTYQAGDRYEYHDDYGDWWKFEYPGWSSLYVDQSTVIRTEPETPAVTSRLYDRSAAVGETSAFTVTADGGALSYQWYYKTPTGSWTRSTLTGAKTATLSVPVIAARDGYQYKCKVSNAAGYVYSNAAKLTVKSAVTSQPADKHLAVGKTAKFTVNATGADLSYQWYYKTPGGSWTKSTLTGNKTATLTVSATAARNGYQYKCLITDAHGVKTYSRPVMLTVKTTITAQPASVSAAAGKTVTFTVTATGADLSYQWYYKAPGGSWTKSTLTGCKTASLTVKATAARNGYQYKCLITDAHGVRTYSAAATLTVTK